MEELRRRLALSLVLCSTTESAAFELDGSERLPLRRFKPKDAPAKEAIQRMLATAAHGDVLWFELQVRTEKLSGSIEGPPLTAPLSVHRIQSGDDVCSCGPGVLPPNVLAHCAGEQGHSGQAPAEGPATGPIATYPVTLALDRQEYNRTSTMFALVGAPQFPSSEDRLAINRIRPDGSKTPVGDNQLVNVRFGAKEPGNQTTSQRFDVSLSPGDRFESTLSGKEPMLDSRVHVVVSVQIVRDPVTPPEAGYALLRRITAAPTAAVACFLFTWSPLADRVVLIAPADLLGDSVRRRAVSRWSDAVRPSLPVYYGVQRLSPGGSVLIPPLLPASLQCGLPRPRTGFPVPNNGRVTRASTARFAAKSE